MKYKYPSIYKYGLLLLIIYMFFKHQNSMSSDKLLTNSIVITIIVGLIDFIIIKNHPNLLETESQQEKEYQKQIERERREKEKREKEKEEETLSDEDIDEIINSYDIYTDTY